MRGVDLFVLESEEFILKNDGFSLSWDPNGHIVLSGTLHLRDERGEYIDSYEISIKPTDLYPSEFPHVFETGERIPRNVDWHVFEESGRVCLCALPEEVIACRSFFSLDLFVKKYVTPYFFSQLFREINGFFLQERTHGLLGTVEFLFDIFKTKDVQSVLSGLVFVRKRKELNRVDLCFCGSGEKFRKCHRQAFRDLILLTDTELDAFIYIFSNLNRDLLISGYAGRSGSP